jgi:hypothetical protein
MVALGLKIASVRSKKFLKKRLQFPGNDVNILSVMNEVSSSKKGIDF